MTSDSTISIFTGNLFVGSRGASSNTYGIGGECNHAPDSKGEGYSHGVVVYEDGFLKISIPGSEGISDSEVHFHRLLFYHTFYKIIRSMGLMKGSLMKCPSKLTLRYWMPMFCFQSTIYQQWAFGLHCYPFWLSPGCVLAGKAKNELDFSAKAWHPTMRC